LFLSQRLLQDDQPKIQQITLDPQKYNGLTKNTKRVFGPTRNTIYPPNIQLFSWTHKIYKLFPKDPPNIQIYLIEFIFCTSQS
jgi:hypothetical protein